MAEPERDDSAIDAGFKQRHCGGVAEDVGRDMFSGKCGTAPSCGVGVFGDEPFDCIPAEGGVRRRLGKTRSVTLARFSASQARMTAGVCRVRGVHRSLSTLAVTAHVRTNAETDEILDAEPGDLGNAQARLYRQGQQCMITPSEPSWSGLARRAEPRSQPG